MAQQQTPAARTTAPEPPELPPDIAPHEPVIEESRAKRLYFIIGIVVVLMYLPIFELAGNIKVD